MIITSPTGLYATVLPSEPSDSRSVTFTISNEPPPRTNLLFPKIPAGVLFRSRNPTIIDSTTRRQSVGEMLFGVSKGSRSIPGNNARQFEIGQILEFTDAELQELEPMLVSDRTETRHDINLLDLPGLGLSEQEIDTIAEQSQLAQESLTVKLNDLKRVRSDAEKRISANQRVVNESNKTISALEVTIEQISDTSGLDEMIEKLKDTRDEASAKIRADTAIANDAAAESTLVLDQLRSLTTVVK